MVALFADSNRARIRYIKESDTAWGTTPASGITRELRYTGSTLNAQKDTTISEEIRADRMVPDIVETAARSSGDMNVEFSAGSHDDFMEGFFYGAWSRPMTFDGYKGSQVSWGANNKVYIAGKDVSNYFTVGHRIRTNGYIDPLNNSYYQISAVTFNSGANRTEITVATTTSVIEGGTAFTSVADANDVIVLKNTHVRCGTSGAASFDSNTNNAFAAAIAAGQLVAGQKVYIEGLGYETGTVTVADPGDALVASGATITVNDGVNVATFQFGGSTLPGNIAVVADGVAADTTAANLTAALNALRPSGKLAVSATHTTGVVTIKNLNGVHGAITKAGDTNTAFTNVDFSGLHADARGIFTVQSATDDTLTVSPTPPTINNSTVAVTIKGAMLRNPADAADIVPHSFSLEVTYEDINRFRLADGQRVSTFAYNIAAGSILTGSYGFMGRAIQKLNAAKLGDSGSYTVLDTTATPVANATVNVGTISLDGSPLSTALKTITVNGNNNLRDQQAVGNKFPVGIGAGRIEITGSVEAYFANDDMWDKFINHETVSLGWNITDVDQNHYEFTVPACVFSTDTENPAGGNQDIMENMDWTAKRDPLTNCMFQIDRFSAITPTTS